MQFEIVRETNNTKTDGPRDIDILMPMYNFKNIVALIRKHQKVYSDTIEMD